MSYKQTHKTSSLLHYLNQGERQLFGLLRPNQLQRFSRVALSELAPFRDTRSIFVHIPKTAGISVRRALYGADVGNHMNLRDYFYTFTSLEFAEYFKFTFVRNPWDRLYSSFCYLSGNSCTLDDKRWWSSVFDPNISFSEFVTEYIASRGLPSYLHFRPQASFLSTSRIRWLSSELLAPIYIGRYETLQEDFFIIAQVLGISSTLEHLNSSQKRQGQSYRDAYTPEMIGIISKAYKSDILAFGYSFDNLSNREQRIAPSVASR